MEVFPNIGKQGPAAFSFISHLCSLNAASESTVRIDCFWAGPPLVNLEVHIRGPETWEAAGARKRLGAGMHDIHARLTF